MTYDSPVAAHLAMLRIGKPLHAAVVALAIGGVLTTYPTPSVAGWTRPQTVTSGSPLFGEPLLFAGPAGELLSWSYAAAPHRTEGAGESVAGAEMHFGSPRPLPYGINGRRLVDLGGGRVAQLILKPTGLNTSAMSVSLGSTNGVFSHPLHANGSVYAGRASLAGDRRGDLLLAWIAANGNGSHRQVWASVRPPGKGFAAPRLINGSAEAEQVQTGVGVGGAMAIAFASKEPHELMFARVRPPRGRWGPQQNIGPAAEGAENDTSIFVTAAGDAIVAWYHTQACAAGCESPGFVDVAVHRAHARRFAPVQLLWRSTYGLIGVSSGISLAPALAAAPGGAPLVAFLARVGSAGPSTTPLVPTAVMVATPSGSRYGAAHEISPPGQQEADVAAAAGTHGALVTWIKVEPLHFGGPVVAAIGDVRGHFGAPEQISPLEEAFKAVPVFNPNGRWPANETGPWTVAWTGRAFGLPPAASVTETVSASAPLCPLPPAAPDPACVGG